MKERITKGFTLIELLIVVAIIAILAAIAVPNFLEAQVRAKISRAKADMRSLATAIEAYTVDWNKVPKHLYNVQPVEARWAVMTTPISYITSILADPFGDMNINETGTPFMSTYSYASPFGGQWCMYKTFEFSIRNDDFPDSYEMMYLFVPDVTDPNGLDAGLDALAGHQVQWYTASQGPDQVVGLDTLSSSGQGSGFKVDRVLDIFYDPSNGTVSQGDVIRYGP